MWCSTAIEYSDYYLVQALMVFPFSITARVTYMSYERENLIHQEMLKADVGVVPSPFFLYHLKRDVKYTLLIKFETPRRVPNAFNFFFVI